MSSEYQLAFNVLLSLVAFLGGWVLNSVRDSVKSLHDSDELLSTKVQSIEVLVAGQYVTRDEMGKLTDAIFRKLDKIDMKLDRKQDRDNV